MDRSFLRAAFFACIFSFAIVGSANGQEAALRGDFASTMVRAKQITNRLYGLHEVGGAVFSSAIDYCRTIRSARATLSRLYEMYSIAIATGNTLAALRIASVGKDLEDELAYEDWLDSEYGWRTWCSPTAWDDYGPDQGTFSQPIMQLMVNLGFGPSSYDAGVATSIPSAASGTSDSPTVGSAGLDLRTFIWLNQQVALTLGFWGQAYFSNEILRALDLDNFSPGNDTFTSIQRKRAFLAYVGLTLAWPTISAIQAGIAGQPGAGTFLTTFYGGPRRESLDGSVTTNELGAIRTTNFSETLTAWTFGFDLDYPLWLSGTATAVAYGLRPMIGFGVAFDTYPSFTVNHTTALAFLYANTIAMETAVRAYVRLGAQFQAQELR